MCINVYQCVSMYAQRISFCIDVVSNILNFLATTLQLLSSFLVFVHRFKSLKIALYAKKNRGNTALLPT